MAHRTDIPRDMGILRLAGLTLVRSFDYGGRDPVMADSLPQPAVLVADRGYSLDKIRKAIKSRYALPMIPMRTNRKVCKAVDMTTYSLSQMVIAA